MHSSLPRRTFLRTALGAGAALATRSTAAPAAPTVTWLTPADKGYAAARQTYNSTLKAQPAIIARCLKEDGVIQAIARAAAENKSIAVKSGGHSFEGFCINEGGLVVEVSGMNGIHLDSKTGIVTAGPGCKLGQMNQALLAKGRLLPSGSCAGVGLSGLVLGGGYGIFARQFGLTCDHLLGLRLVDGEGNVRDSRDEPELLWACRGGGNGHFGIVTELRLQTHPAPKTLHAFKFKAAGLDAARATALLKAYFEASAALTDNAFAAFVLNGNILSILLTTTGSPENKGLAAFRKQMTGLGMKPTVSKPVPLATALPRYYGEPGPIAFKNASGGYYSKFEDLAPALPGILHELFTVPGLIFQVNTLGGAIARGPDCAYPHRSYPWLGEWQAYWQKDSQREKLTAAAGRIREHLAAAGITRHYANYPDLAFKGWQQSYYDTGYARLQALKKKLDPANRIRHAQSVSA